MKKSLVSVFLVLTMLFAFAVPAFASVEGKLSATATPSSDGTSFTVDLSISENSGFAALEVNAKYDDSVLKLKSAKNREAFEDLIFMPSKNIDVNPYILIWYEPSGENIDTNGVLASCTFEVLSTAAVGDTEIVFEVKDVADFAGDTDVKITPCTFKVKVDKNEGDSNAETSSKNQTTSQKGDSLVVQKPTATPDSNTTVSDDSNSQDNSSDTITIGAETEKETTPQEKSNLTTVIVILAVLVLGSAVVLIIVLSKKKKEK